MSTLKQTLSYLILGQRGGQNRIEIIETLKERPYNLNQLAGHLNLNYRTVKHHIDMLMKHGFVSASSSGKYGEVYFISADLERNNDILEEVKKKLTDVTTSPRLFQSVMEQTNDAVFLIDEDRLVIFCNNGANRIFGISREKSIGKVLNIFKEPDRLRKILSTIKAGKTVRGFETEGKRKDGTVIDIEVSVDHINDASGNLIGYSIISRDITERKKLLEDLIRSEERYSLAQRAANIGSWDWNITTGNLKWSETIEPIFGYEPGKFEGTYKAYLKSVHPDDRKALEERVNGCIKYGKKFNLEHRILWPDGTVRWIRETGDTIRNRNNKPVRMVGIVRDITDRKDIEKRMKHLASFPHLNPNPIIETDMNGKVLFFNKGVARTLKGIGAKMNIVLFLPKDFVQILKSFRNGKTDSLIRDVRIGSAIFQERVTYVSEFNTVRIYAIDVSEQVSAEKMLGIVLETAPEGFWITDLNGILKEVNDYYCKMVGYDRDELIGMNIDRLEADESLEQTKHHIKKVIQEGYDLFQTRHRRKDGTFISLEISANHSPMDGGVIIVFLRDITERMRIEVKLKESEVRYRRLFETARDGILILDAENGAVIEENPYLVEMLGFSHQQFVGKKIWDLGFLKDIIRNKDKFLELQRKKYVRYEDLPLETADGHRMDVEFVSNVYSVENKQVIQCNIRDITERKALNDALKVAKDNLEKQVRERTIELANANKDLKEAATRFQHAFDNMMEGCMIIDRDWTYLYVNDVAAEHGQQKVEKLIGHTMMEMYPGLEKSDIFMAYKRCMERRSPQRIQSSFIFADGTQRWYEFSIQPVPEGIFVLSLDITKRVLAERKNTMDTVKESEEKFRLIADNINDMVVFTSPDGTIEYINPACNNILGFKPDELIGKRPLIVYKEDEAKVKDAFKKALEVGRQKNLRYRIVTKSGDVRWILHSYIPVKKDDKLQFIVGVIKNTA